MKLLFAAPSPYSRKVRVLAHELCLADHIEEEPVVTTPVAPAATWQEKHPALSQFHKEVSVRASMQQTQP